MAHAVGGEDHVPGGARSDDVFFLARDAVGADDLGAPDTFAPRQIDVEAIHEPAMEPIVPDHVEGRLIGADELGKVRVERRIVHRAAFLRRTVSTFTGAPQ